MSESKWRASLKPNRRDFVGGALAAGPILGAEAMSGFNPLSAATPKKGGHIRLGVAEGSTSDLLDPAPDSSAFITFLSSTYLSQLTEVSADGSLKPLLAESFEASADAKKWTFDLRKGVEFHDGKSLTADDVVATINHHRDEDSKSSMKAFAAQVEDIKADGKNRVILTLKEGNADYPFILSTGSFSILPSEDGKVMADAGNGTGPFVLKDIERGVRANLERNPNYFGDDAAHADSAEVLIIADAAARTNALLTDEVDLIDKLDLKTLDLLKRSSDDIEILDVTGTQHYTLPMNTTLAPFDDNNVRMALKHAINREELLDKILRGHGAIGNDHPISPANRYFNTELEQRPYDPEKAKFYLKEAGLSSLDVKLSASEAIWTGAIDAVTLYSEHAAKAGINLQVNRVPNDGYWSNVWMTHPWAASYWSGRPTEDWMFSQGYAADSSWNETFWKNDSFNGLLKAARAELDDAKRKQMYWEMQALVRDDGGSVVPLFANHVMGYNKKKLGHPDKIGGNWNLDGYKILQRWWTTS